MRPNSSCSHAFHWREEMRWCCMNTMAFLHIKAVTDRWNDWLYIFVLGNLVWLRPSGNLSTRIWPLYLLWHCLTCQRLLGLLMKSLNKFWLVTTTSNKVTGDMQEGKRNSLLKSCHWDSPKEQGWNVNSYWRCIWAHSSVSGCGIFLFGAARAHIVGHWMR